jgi:Arc/MetJ-type ribon-helix-helix transcriptional regulator
LWDALAFDADEALLALQQEPKTSRLIPDFFALAESTRPKIVITPATAVRSTFWFEEEELVMPPRPHSPTPAGDPTTSRILPEDIAPRRSSTPPRSAGPGRIGLSGALGTFGYVQRIMRKAEEAETRGSEVLNADFGLDDVRDALRRDVEDFKEIREALAAMPIPAAAATPVRGRSPQRQGSTARHVSPAHAPSLKPTMAIVPWDGERDTLAAAIAGFQAAIRVDWKVYAREDALHAVFLQFIARSPDLQNFYLEDPIFEGNEYLDKNSLVRQVEQSLDSVKVIFGVAGATRQLDGIAEYKAMYQGSDDFGVFLTRLQQAARKANIIDRAQFQNPDTAPHFVMDLKRKTRAALRERIETRYGPLATASEFIRAALELDPVTPRAPAKVKAAPIVIPAAATRLVSGNARTATQAAQTLAVNGACVGCGSHDHKWKNCHRKSEAAVRSTADAFFQALEDNRARKGLPPLNQARAPAPAAAVAAPAVGEE